MIYICFCLGGAGGGAKNGFWWGCALVPKVTFGRLPPKHKSPWHAVPIVAFGGGAHWHQKWLLVGVCIGTKSDFWWGCASVSKMILETCKSPWYGGF